MRGLAVTLVLSMPAMAAPVMGVSAAEPAPAQIVIFTDAAHPVTSVAAIQRELADTTTIRYLTIDAQARLERALSRDLPADPKQARAIALKRIQMLDPERLAGELSDAFQALLLARRYGIDRYPAIVFDDGASVVYGATDLARALRLYRRAARERP